MPSHYSHLNLSGLASKYNKIKFGHYFLGNNYLFRFSESEKGINEILMHSLLLRESDWKPSLRMSKDTGLRLLAFFASVCMADPEEQITILRLSIVESTRLWVLIIKIFGNSLVKIILIYPWGIQYATFPQKEKFIALEDPFINLNFRKFFIHFTVHMQNMNRDAVRDLETIRNGRRARAPRRRLYVNQDTRIREAVRGLAQGRLNIDEFLQLTSNLFNPLRNLRENENIQLNDQVNI